MSARADAAAMFAGLWAVAAIFHVFSAPMRYQVVPAPDAAGVSALAVGIAALAVLARPRDARLLVALAAMQVVSVWSEAPVLGNHWLIAGFVALAILVAAISVRRRTGELALEPLYATFAPTARWVLLLSYAFAAFAKLNHGFLDPAVSCAVFFLRESATAVGLAATVERAPEAVFAAVIGATVVIEVAVPVLLLVRRTRVWGVLLAVVFHTVLGLDLAHPFFDFSTLLFALFFLFLPPAFVVWLRAKLGMDGESARRRPARRSLVWTSRAVQTGLLLAAVGPPDQRLAVLVFASAYLAWFAYAAMTVVAVAGYILPQRPRAGGGSLRTAKPVALAVLPLVVLNGLTPYLELKTAFGFTMYSNLVTVDGRSNHLLVARTLPLTDAHEDLVVLRSSDDPDLQWYADNEYALPWRTFQDYLAEHAGISVEYVHDGTWRRHAPGAETVTAAAGVPSWQEKLQPFRAVDLHDPPRCQDRWGPAN